MDKLCKCFQMGAEVAELFKFFAAKGEYWTGTRSSGQGRFQGRVMAERGGEPSPLIPNPGPCLVDLDDSL